MLYDAERGDMTIAVVGDAMISRRMRAFRELQFLKLVEIVRNADVSIANLEFLFHDYESAWQWTRGTYTRSDPKNLNSTSDPCMIAAAVKRGNRAGRILQAARPDKVRPRQQQ